MTWTAALFVVAAFLALAHALKVPALARDVAARGRRALADVRDPDLDDLAKERAVRAHAGRLLGLFVLITLASAVAVAVPLGVVWVLDRADVVRFDAVLDLTVSWDFLLVATVLGVAATLLLRRRRP